MRNSLVMSVISVSMIFSQKFPFSRGHATLVSCVTLNLIVQEISVIFYQNFVQAVKISSKIAHGTTLSLIVAVAFNHFIQKRERAIR